MRIFKKGADLRRYVNNIDCNVLVKNGKVYHEGKVIAILLHERSRELLRGMIEKRKLRWTRP